MITLNIHPSITYMGNVVMIANATGIATSESLRHNIRQRITDSVSDRIHHNGMVFTKSCKPVLEHCLTGNSLLLSLHVSSYPSFVDPSKMKSPSLGNTEVEILYCTITDSFTGVLNTVSLQPTVSDRYVATIDYDTPERKPYRKFDLPVTELSSIPQPILQELLDFHHQEQYNLFSC